MMEHAGFEPASWLFPMGVKANRNQNVPLGGMFPAKAPETIPMHVDTNVVRWTTFSYIYDSTADTDVHTGHAEKTNKKSPCRTRGKGD